MKITIKKTALIIALCGMVSLASAQKIAHLSLDSLISLMPETKIAKEAAQNYLKGIDAESIDMQNELERKYKDYLEKEATMSDLLKKTKQDDLNQLQRRIEDFKQQAQMDYQRKTAELTAPIMDKAKKGIEAVAKEGGYKYVLDTSAGSVLYSEPSDDVLMAVKKKLDSMPAAIIPGGNNPTGGVKPAPGGGKTAPKAK
ncbi:OmpH family outer membrane protein [Sediminibacterium sp.]|uniref:OmpH family outer membrane protein n=1 Tax=Sediminibacterium sp. TaxID=1917865 RepID=UPI00271BC903|nr:OmpH family outer membrane protein [Sediminibacterium sp.]MDO9000473.1 OmpH family outer membrane protein [Bacteroidota bacterium]MDP3146959.1 OmpH family outer membrane protein [Bacteroidota bacterium]MDP3567503.1 OmpH family outer membrane protein [Sediminibacterium sp.]